MKARSLILDEGVTGKSGEIVVTATKDEWIEVIDCLLRYQDPRGSVDRLVHWLINQGVYE